MATTATAASQTEPDTSVVPSNDHSTRRPSMSKLRMRFHDAVSHSPLSAQPNNLARRLHAMLPSTASSNNVPAVTVSTPPATIEPTLAPNHSPFIKIRIITWNMHESLPKGDLDALLGIVPRYTPKGTLGNTLNIEGLSMGANHPYHIVVIAGQECPTLMGLPMGLGGGFKWSKDDDEREKEHKEKEGHRPKSTKDKEKDKDKDPEKDERRQSSEHDRTLDTPLPAITSTPTPSVKEKEKEKEQHALGWSAILEDHFSRGIGSVDMKPALSPPVTTSSTSKQVSSSGSTSSPCPEHLQPPPCPTRPRSNSNDMIMKLSQGGPHVPRLGPYELITKERMMGLYLAVYVHRDSEKLVHGHSKSAVTAGLIGGRLGNKGGVGISLKFNDTSFLFINAHLAAHEGRKAHRLANMAKIKAELTVDPFLQPDDPRTVAEDITDRFDHTFIFGDLNFRLDVTRLHADWLVSRQAFAQAQEFDQLRQIMKSGEAFDGFKEGPINFPPTFKYDVLRTIKRKKSLKANSSRHALVLPEIEEKTGAHGSIEDEPEHEGGDSVSVLSSAWASNLSRMTSRSSSCSSGSGRTKEKDKETEITTTNAQLNANDSPSDVSGIVHRAKAKWSNLVHSSTSSKELSRSPSRSSAQASVTRTKSLTRRFSVKRTRHPATLAGSKVQVVEPKEKLLMQHTVTSSVSVPTGHGGGPVSASLTAEDMPRKSTSSFTAEIVKGSGEVITKITKNVSRSSVTRRGPHNKDEQITEELSKGIYDSSSKRRVPSWCDRILYKSTVIPPPDPEPEPACPALQESTSGLLRSGQRVGQFLANAFKPRNRRGSTSSISTTATNPPGTSPDGSPVLDLERRGSGPRGRQKPLPVIPVPMTKSLDSGGVTSVPFSAPSHTAHTNAIDSHSKRRSTDPVHGASSVDSSPSLLRRRSASGPLPAPATASGPGIPALPMPELDPQPVPASTGPRRWFSMQFLSVIHNLHAGPSPVTQTQQAPPVPPPPLHRKGDMICIAYETLSDKEMRRLEGRSDHRPVIGHYAVFV